MYSAFKKLLYLSCACLTISLTGCGGSASGGTTVNPYPSRLYSTTIAWEAPSERMDGSSLSFNDIAGYKVYMGPTASDLVLIQTIENPQSLSTNISDLPQGTHYFAIATYDFNNLTSPLSKIIIREF